MKKDIKHTPIIKEKQNNKVIIQVGEVLHPMSNDHLISDIKIHTDNRTIEKKLDPNQQPIIEIELEDKENIQSIEATCNIHGSWINKFND